MLQQIDSTHIAALEAELQRVKAQRDALRDALSGCITDCPQDVINAGRGARRLIAINAEARAALQACQD